MNDMYAYANVMFYLQVVRGDFIIYFNKIFDALCKLSADSDANVQSAAHLLDRLVKVWLGLYAFDIMCIIFLTALIN